MKKETLKELKELIKTFEARKLYCLNNDSILTNSDLKKLITLVDKLDTAGNTNTLIDDLPF